MTKITDERVIRINSPEKCEVFAKNCLERDRKDLALQAKQKAIQLRADAYGSGSNAEKEALEAVYAYEEVLTARNGKRTRAGRTWPMIKKYGILEAVERAVNRPVETLGYTALVEMGLEDYAFEAVIIRYPELFSKDALKISQERMNKWKN